MIARVLSGLCIYTFLHFYLLLTYILREGGAVFLVEGCDGTDVDVDAFIASWIQHTPFWLLSQSRS